jgi:hypothetical protein
MSNISIEELKALVIWAKQQRIKSMSFQGFNFEFSELAHIESLPDVMNGQPDLSKPAYSSKLPGGNTEPSDDEKDLYWSSGV